MASIDLPKPAFRARLTGTTTSHNVLLPEQRQKFLRFDNDGPGELAWDGPRHDNDHIDYRKIQILPTADEILAVQRPVYMPKKYADELDHLPNGIPRLLDTQFRHLRYDSIESIRDICYTAAQLYVYRNSYFESCIKEPFLETPAGNRFHAYSNVRVEELVPHEKHGIMPKLSFNCPSHLVGQKIHKSGQLETGMLCALLILNNTTNEFSIVYFDVHLRQSTYAMDPKGTATSKAAVQLSFHEKASYDDILQISRLAHNICTDVDLVLIEFPKTLYIGFFYPLRCLQQIRPEDIAFHKYLAPEYRDVSSPNGEYPVSPPAYALHQNFQYDLTPITTSDSKAGFPLEAFDGKWLDWTVKYIMQHTTLDKGQAVALCNSLNRELAFTLGPPGTGKTFLGVALTRVILASQLGHEKKPILIVCLTNHALDSFMGDLRDAGVSSLLRIGNGSKEDWTKAINLYEKSRKHRYKGQEFEDRRGLISQKKHLFNETSAWCEGMTVKLDTGRPAWIQIGPIVKKSNYQYYLQLVTDTDSSATQAFTFDFWAGGGDLAHLQDLHRELYQPMVETAAHRTTRFSSACAYPPFPSGDLMMIVSEMLESISAYTTSQSMKAGDENLWQLTYAERQNLISRWSAEIDEEASARDLAYIQCQFQELMATDKQSKQLKDIRIMKQQDIIGVTTTTCAARWEVLRELAPDVLICEEAGEVLEAHTLCSLLPSIKQAIFIGDPLQLRPQVNQEMLTVETGIGALYRLDESLFERLMFQRTSAAPVLPTSSLNIQRRMHPQIANISRLTYPFLRDHEDTASHPMPKGLAGRMFWLDHSMPEAIDDEEFSDSIWNPHEVNVITAFVKYLLRGSEYSMGDIAVITPYAAQLRKLINSLQQSCSIWLSERDRELLIDGGDLDVDSEHLRSKQDISMGNMIRIATVDNFQGEEARVIILSTVRSGGKSGFLKNQNRINVACSRARDGFYIIGNAETLSQVPMWNNVIKIMDEANCRGTSIRLQCNRHADYHHALASNADDFVAFPQCSWECHAILRCEHVCPEKCHELELHDRIPCMQPCLKILDCGHKCENLCSSLCGPCNKSTETDQLPCGHVGLRLCSGMLQVCMQVVNTKPLPCGRHIIDVHCGGQDNKFVCKNKCDLNLECGHKCPGWCQQCSEAQQHQPCVEICNKLMSCEHACQSFCHKNTPCPPCQQPCTKSCRHDRCSNLCCKPCDPCLRLNVIRVRGHAREIKTSIACCLMNGKDPMEVLDRILLKVYGRLNNAAYSVETEENRLDRSFNQFKSDISPNSLAAKSNSTAVLQRDRIMLNLQNQILNYKSNVVDAVLNSMELRGHSTTSKLLTLPLRCDALEYRVIQIRQDDKLRVIDYFLKLSGDDPSQGLLRQAVSMLKFVHMECATSIICCQETIYDWRLETNPFLEAEIRLHHVRFHLLIWSVASRLQAYHFAKPDQKQARDVAYNCDYGLFESLDRVEEIAEHHSSSKPFLRYVREYRALIHSMVNAEDDESTSMPMLESHRPQSNEGRQIEKAWARHKLGHLVLCDKKNHPYSSLTFPDGCPECGQWQETEAERYERHQHILAKEARQAKQHLQEDAFLQVIQAKSPQTTPKELTPEEKFFEAMKKMQISM